MAGSDVEPDVLNVVKSCHSIYLFICLFFGEVDDFHVIHLGTWF